METLLKQTVQDFLNIQGFFDLKGVVESTTIAEFLDVLSRFKISSAPIIDSQNVIKGWVDMLDLITATTTRFSSISLLTDPGSQSQLETFSTTLVKDIANISERNQFTTVPPSCTLLRVLELLSQPNCHRVVITDDKNTVVGLLTQSRLLRYLHDQKDTVSPLLHRSIKHAFALELKSQQIVTIHMNDLVINAVKKIREENVSGLAVIDDNEKLVSNFSASDLKHVRILPIGNFIEDLAEPIKQFMYFRTSLKDKIMMVHLPKFDPIFVEENQTVGLALELLATHEIHRIYVTDKHQKPLHVISLSDMLSLFLKEYFISS